MPNALKTKEREMNSSLSFALSAFGTCKAWLLKRSFGIFSIFQYQLADVDWRNFCINVSWLNAKCKNIVRFVNLSS